MPAARTHIRRPTPPRARVRDVLVSFAAWTVTHARWRLWNLVDRARGASSLDSKARRLGQAIERMGATGVKVGRQVAMRIDLMPLEFSLALSATDDRRAPMPFAEATRRIEAAAGRRLSEVFAAVDPEPIASTTAFCVYRGALADGQPVAVKVRRPGVRNRLSADLVAVTWILRALELTTLWRPGFFTALRQELATLANDRLDLYHQARFQAVFRRVARSDGPRYATAPRVFPALSNHAVLVSAFAGGLPLSEVVTAVRSGDPDALRRLAEAGVDPEVVGQRLLHVAWWAAFEGLFFGSGPRPETILVQPGNRLVFVDFEDAATLSTAQKRHFQQVLAQLGAADVSGAARSLVQVLAPLPHIDVFDFTKRIETGLWQELLAFRDREAEWWERTTIGVWRTAMRAARADALTVRLDVLRFMASMLAYDTLAATLVPELDLLRTFRRYRRAADARAARRARRQLARVDPDHAQAAVVARIAELADGADRLGSWLGARVDALPIANVAVSGTAAYAVSQAVRLAGVLALLLGVGAVEAAARGSTDALASAVASPWIGLVGCALAAVSVRRVLLRLHDHR